MTLSRLRFAVIVLAAALTFFAVGAELVGIGARGFGQNQVASLSIALLLFLVAFSRANVASLCLALVIGIGSTLLIHLPYLWGKRTLLVKDPYPWIQLAEQAEFSIPDEAFTIAVLPDTQNYAWKYPALLDRQIDWLVENAEEQNIELVVHLGDVTRHNSEVEWQRARQSLARLDGVVPYAVLTGNHDYGDNGRSDTRGSLLTSYFPVSHFQRMETFGGVYDREPDKSDNSYHTFSALGRKWLVLFLEFGPRDDVLRWANGIASRYSDHLMILATHAYLHQNGERFDHTRKTDFQSPYGHAIADTGVNDGQEIWDKLVSKHAQFVLTLSGHVVGDGIDLLSSRGEAGGTVHQMVVNYQSVENGGNGWLRLLGFSPNGTLTVQDYSPVLERYNSHPSASFQLVIDRLPEISLSN